MQVRLVAKDNYGNGTSGIIVYLSKSTNQSDGKTDINTLYYARTQIFTDTTLREYILGTPVWMWGGMTAAEVNAAAFGLVPRGNTTGDSPTFTYSIDNLQVRIFYTI